LLCPEERCRISEALLNLNEAISYDPATGSKKPCALGVVYKRMITNNAIGVGGQFINGRRTAM